ncbi:DUF1684 domain-containing protein [Emticicia sp. C21]|uniref:DUF1684 domain-containing protein n=1 Tax=Emticicia sp. C21 TaxID=2302915 RepID=UPI000E34340A|nr:DUF1684 domain-containing protein [Emticicia sp. C21]RFS14177.1 DUF1684 domain-containing protein [Emticicia sp. C21]
MKGSKSIWILFSISLIVELLSSGFNKISDTRPYEDEIKAWHNKRIENLKKENGWLNLAGLFWLEEGKNTFGTGSSNKIVFPKGKSDDFLGTLILEKGEVFIETTADKAIFNNEQSVTKLKIFPLEKPTILKHKSLRWFIIKRGDKYGIRLRDLESPFLKEFTGIETFPIDEKWKIKAKLVKEENKKISILDVLGQTNLQDSSGKLVFTIAGKEYSLDALKEGESLFIIFADKTNKKETYGAGRFVYTTKPDDNGEVYLDFNKATNPPCAFTPYATCPLPPMQNTLPIAVNVGEKNYGHH